MILLTTDEVAEMLKVKPATVKWWRHRRKGPPFIQVPGSQKVLYSSDEVNRWLRQGKVDANHPRPPRYRSRTEEPPDAAA